jgi:hypothetical protein
VEMPEGKLLRLPEEWEKYRASLADPSEAPAIRQL